MTKATELAQALTGAEGWSHSDAIEYLASLQVTGEDDEDNLTYRLQKEAIAEALTCPLSQAPVPEPAEPEPEVVYEVPHTMTSVGQLAALGREVEGLYMQVYGVKSYRALVDHDTGKLLRDINDYACGPRGVRVRDKYEALLSRWIELAHPRTIEDEEAKAGQIVADALSYATGDTTLDRMEAQWQADLDSVTLYEDKAARNDGWMNVGTSFEIPQTPELWSNTRISVNCTEVAWPPKEEPMTTARSVLDEIRSFGRASNMYASSTVEELRQYCRKIKADNPSLKGLAGFSKASKADLCRRLATLAEIEFDIMVAAPVVSPEEKEADEAREATIQAAEAEKDAQPAPPETKVTMAKYRKAKALAEYYSALDGEMNQLIAKGHATQALKIKALLDGKPTQGYDDILAELREEYKDLKAKAAPQPQAKLVATTVDITEETSGPVPLEGTPQEVAARLLARAKRAKVHGLLTHNDRGEIVFRVDKEHVLRLEQPAKALESRHNSWLNITRWVNFGWIVDILPA
jgi:hypothetical protein